ncbi:prenyltransferase/squalene oxidase repeat-containing protein [Streptomyces sp. NPDC051976]|uniref:prenyltransferase/squalene oxidase repeat-containing protein n=1 Tax=Streptomyces sp. NPDC051976 TaxID=3154947 RepID=UPI003428C1E0
MPLRRRAAVLVVTAAVSALSALSVPAATADTATPSASASAPKPPSGLYGAGDPTYDGVWRQSYALLALKTAGVNPAAAAVGWLTGQQCADGGFPSYRANTAVACDPKHEDTNATGIAVQALAALGGHDAATAKAVAWLATVQNADGGWSYNPGGASDPDSVGVVIGALKAAGKDPAATAKGGKTPYDALRTFQFGCAAKPADRGAFGYPMNGKLTVNAKATADAVRGAQGATFVVAAPAADIAARVPACVTGHDTAVATPADVANAGAAYLTAQLTAGGDHLTAVTPGADKPTADYGTTADAVIALAAGGHLTSAKSAYTWLAANSAAWSRGNPAALSQLVLAAHATGADPRAAGGADLVRQLTNLGPAPTTPPATPAKKKDSKKSSTASTLLIVGVFFIASVGFGLFLSARKKRQP